MKEKILIIEDDPLIRNELKTLLQSNGYKTVAPEDFSDVIDQIKAEQPHLIILDIKLPGTSGFSLCTEIRTFSEVPIIFVTSCNTDMDELNSINRKLFRDSQGSQFHAALWVTQTEPQFLIRQFQLQHFLIGLSGYLMAQKFERVKALHLVQFCHCRNCFVHHRHRITFFVHVGNSFLT